MLNRKLINLFFSITLVLSLLILIAATYSVSSTDASAKMLKAKVLRRRDQVKLKPRVEELLAAQQGEDQRTFKMRDSKDLPLAVRRVKNLQSDTWYKDLEIEVKNTSTKPIYSILAYVDFPDDKLSGNSVSGISAVYGDRKYIDIRRIGDPQDPHLNPGDTYVFTIPERFKRGLKAKQERSPHAFKRFELHFGVISFGDGTGFEVGDFTDYRSMTAPPVPRMKHHAT